MRICQYMYQDESDRSISSKRKYSTVEHVNYSSIFCIYASIHLSCLSIIELKLHSAHHQSEPEKVRCWW